MAPEQKDGDQTRTKGANTRLLAKARVTTALRKFFRGNRDFYAHGKDYR